MTGTTQRRGARNGRPLSRSKVVKGSEPRAQGLRGDVRSSGQFP